MRDLTAYEELTNCVSKTDSDERFVAKGAKLGVGYNPGLKRVEKWLAEKISEINLPFEDELKTI